jgi:phosphoribosylaminoimidazole-succinocarboxamide synthase
MGKEGEQVPAMTDEWITTISNRYIELYEKLTGEKFQPEELGEEEKHSKIEKALEKVRG